MCQPELFPSTWTLIHHGHLVGLKGGINRAQTHVVVHVTVYAEDTKMREVKM